MEFKTFDEIITYAIEKEKQAVAFYEDLSRHEKSSDMKNTFQSFVKDEQKHVEILTNHSKKNIERYKLKKIHDLQRSNYLVDINYEPGMAFPDILRLAMKREEKAVQLYEDLSKQMEIEENKKLFDVLAQEEKKHKLKIETIFDDLMLERGD